MSSFTIEVNSNAAEVADVLRRVGENVVLRSKVAATNKALTQTRTQIRKDLSRETGVPSKQLGKRFKLYRASFKRQRARLFIGTMPFSVYKLGITELKRGGVSVRGPGGRQKVGDAFVATMPNGKTGVFRRKTRKRLPIAEVKIHIARPTRDIASRHLKTLANKFERLFDTEFTTRVRREVIRVRSS